MLESQVINGWIHKGFVRGAREAGRANLLKVLNARLPSPVPEAVRLAIESTNVSDTLDRWFDAALQASSWTEFRKAMPLAE